MIFGEGMENHLCYPRDRGGGLGVDVCAGEHTVKRNTIHEAWRKGVSVTIPYGFVIQILTIFKNGFQLLWNDNYLKYNYFLLPNSRHTIGLTNKSSCAKQRFLVLD